MLPMLSAQSPPLVAHLLTPSGQVRSAMSATSIPRAYLTASGDVAYQLEGVVDALQADAIVIGRSVRRRCLLRGSVVRRLVTSSRRIVVVVP